MSNDVPSLRIDELLAHAGWVSGLALSLVKDPGAADDIVQETWLAAMRKPPAGDRPLKGWLAGVVRNLARQRWRGEGRRAKRERLVGQRREALPSTDDLAERMETQRDLAEAILQLAEPLRATVILRYLEGVSSAEIARRQDVPAATVRGRLKRALAELRRGLDEQHGGDRRAWQVALLPFLRPLPAPLATATSSALVSGALSMTLTTKVLWTTALLAAVLGVLALTDLFPFGQEEVREPDASSTLADAEASQSGTGPTEAPSQPGLERTARPSRAAPGAGIERPRGARMPPLAQVGRIEARIVDAEGRGLSGALMRLANAGATARASSDPRGQVVLEVPERACWGGLEVLISAAGRVTQRLAANAAVGRTTGLGEVVLALAGSVGGRVLDGDGRLLAGAHVSVRPAILSPHQRKRAPVEGATTKALPSPVVAVDGTFTVPGLPPGFVRIWATGEGMRHAFSEPLEVRAGEVSGGVVLTVERLRPDDAIRGRIVYPDGRAAAGVRVIYEMRYPSGSRSATVKTKEDGTFELRSAEPVSAALRFSADDGWWGPRFEDVHTGADVIQVTLRKAKRLRVHLQSADGADLPAVTVMAISQRQPSILSHAVGVPSSDGVIGLSIPNEAYRLEVKATGYRTVVLGRFAAEEDPGPLEASLERLPALRGLVQAGERPLVRARVRLYRPATPTSHVQHNGFDVRVDPSPVAQTRTDAEGRYALGIEEDGLFILRVDAAGFAPAELSDLRVDARRGATGLDFQLDQGGAIEGTVRTTDGRSAEGLIVGLSRADAHARTQRVGKDGRYRFERLLDGPYQVLLVEEEIDPSASSSSEDHGVKPAPIPWSCRVRAGATTAFDLDLRALAAGQAVLHGHVLIDDKAPRGWAFRMKGAPAGAALPPEADRGVLDGEGRFQARAKAPGAYVLLVSSAGQARGRRAFFVPLDLAQGRNDLSLSVRTGVLEGVVASGAPSRDVRLYHLWLRGDGVVGMTQIEPDAEGHFRIEGAFAGKGRIVRLDRAAMARLTPAQSMRPELWPVVRTVEIGAGATVKIEIP